MSKVRGRTGSPDGKDQARRPDAKFLAKRAFGKGTLPEPPRIEKPAVYILGRSPLRSFYYTKGARGKWHTAERVTRGTKWNAYLCSGTAIPKGTRPEIFKAPPAVSGILSTMIAARESHYEAPHISLHEHHASAMRPAEQHAMHFHHSSGTGWVDVPMPGVQTQYQQGGFSQMEVVPHHHHSHASISPVSLEQQLPTFILSMQAVSAEVPGQNAQTPLLQEMHPTQTRNGPGAGAAEIQVQCIHFESQPTAAGRNHDEAPVAQIKSEPPRLHFGEFSQVQETRADAPGLARADRESAREPKQPPAPQKKATAFHAESPKSEEIRAAPEYQAEAYAPPAEFSAQQIRVEEISLPAHIGYIPSVRKKERQLKVTQGAEGIPPQ